MGIPLESWPAFVEEVYRVLKPETGWAAFLEMDTRMRTDDDSLPADSGFRQVRRFAKIWLALILSGINRFLIFTQ